MYSSIFRPNSPPLALMSSITIFATFALAIPMNERAPVWSVITPTLIRRAEADSSIAFSPLQTGLLGSWAAAPDAGGPARAALAPRSDHVTRRRGAQAPRLANEHTRS